MPRPRQAVRKPALTFLRVWRDHRELSQEALAAKTGYSQGMISQWERGDANFTGTNLVVLAKALNCEPRDLLYRHPDADQSISDIVETLPQSEKFRVLEIVKTFKRTPDA